MNYLVWDLLTMLEKFLLLWIGLNFLSLDKKTVIVDERQKSLIKCFRKK